MPVVSDFHLIDLVSQAAAVQRLLRGKSPTEKLDWLAIRGKISHMPSVVPGWPDVYFFESSIGIQCSFAFMNMMMSSTSAVTTVSLWCQTMVERNLAAEAVACFRSPLIAGAGCETWVSRKSDRRDDSQK